MQKLPYLMLLLGITCFLHVNGQDEHFALQQQAPLHYNPSFTGMFQGQMRGGVLFRDQWGTIDKPFATITAYGDKVFPFHHDQIGVGVMLMNDRTGPARLTATKLILSGAYHKRLGNHFISVGLQPGVIFRSISIPTFGNQYVPGQGFFDPSLPNGENGFDNSKLMMVLNGGLAYQYETERYTVGIGQAFYQLNQPNESMYQGDRAPMAIRSVTQIWSVHGFGGMSLKPQVSLLKQHKATELMVIARLERKVTGEWFEEATASLGLAARNNLRGYDGRELPKSFDAIGVLAGLKWETYQLDLAYEFNVSDLSVASSGFGAFEIALTYITGITVKTRKIALPCLRY